MPWRARPPVRVQLELSYAARAPWAPTRRQFQRWTEAACAGGPEAAVARPPRGAPTDRATVVAIRIVGRVRSRSLNLRYRQKDRATNVLSFAGPGRLPNNDYVLGELVICAPVVAAEARLQGKGLAAHWAHMTIHGVLHLLGFDHEVAAQAAKMEPLEIQILDRLGFSDPYA